jgi:transcriptional regulator with XRE-family HTH domain
MEPFERIRVLRKMRGLTQEKLGIAVGFPEDQARQRVYKIEKNKTPLTSNDLRKFADALQTTAADILEGEDATGGRPAHVRVGGAVNSTVVEQGEAIPLIAYSQDGTERRVVGYVERPPSLRGVRHGYAIYAFDDSMEPRYGQGWLLYVNPTKPPRVGRDVLVVRRDGHPPLVRQLERQAQGQVTLRALADDERVVLKHGDIAEMHLIMGSDQEG